MSYLIDAVKGLDAQLHIVGEGPLTQSLQSTVQNGNLKNVILHGRVDDSMLKTLYTQCDIFVLPSVYRGEGFGYVLLEAMEHGCALVSTELGTGTSFVNQAGLSGEVVPPRDMLALHEALKRIIGDDNLLQKYQRNSLERVQEFSLEKMITKIEEVYTEVLE